MNDDRDNPRTCTRHAAVAALVLSCVVLSGAGVAANEPVVAVNEPGVAANEVAIDPLDELKPVLATLLVKFCSYITWPDNAFAHERSRLVIGIVGDDALGKLTTTAVKVAKKGKDDRVIEIRRFDSLVRGDGTPVPIEPLRAKLLECHVLFISRTQESALPLLISTCDRRPCLTISDLDAFARNGGMIEVFRHEKKLWFDVNRLAYERSRLVVKDEFLMAARAVLTEKK